MHAIVRGLWGFEFGIISFAVDFPILSHTVVAISSIHMYNYGQVFISSLPQPSLTCGTVITLGRKCEAGNKTNQSKSQVRLG